MVKNLTKEDHAFLNEALQQAERTTSAKIAVIVRPASASYRDYVLLYSLTLGSIVAIALWAAHSAHSFPFLLAVQLGVILVCECTQSVCPLFICLVPNKIKHHYAEQEAMREFHARHQTDTPFVLLFVSLAEHYVHVVTNPVVHSRIPGDWHKVTEGFTQSVRNQTLRYACAGAIAQIGQILSTKFPMQ